MAKDPIPISAEAIDQAAKSAQNKEAFAAAFVRRVGANELVTLATAIYNDFDFAGALNPRHIRGKNRERVLDPKPIREALETHNAVSENFVAAFIYSADEIISRIIKDAQKYGVGDLEVIINDSARSAPQFKAIRGFLRYAQVPAHDFIRERKSATAALCKELQALTQMRSNEQPELKKLSDQYAAALKALRKDRGAYRVYLKGMQIETFLRLKSEMPTDPDRNPPIDADLLFLTQSLIVAHAGLIMLFPDINHLTEELDRYREQAESIDALRDRVLDPLLDQLVSSNEIFDEETLGITRDIKTMDEAEQAMPLPPSRSSTAVKHGWLRGALVGMARFLLHQIKRAAKTAADTVTKEVIKKLVNDPNALTQAIFTFLVASQPVLYRIADSLRNAFGWVRPFLDYLGLMK